MQTPLSHLVNTIRSMCLDNICPWADQQTPALILEYLAKEQEECIEALQENKSAYDIASEAGDVFVLSLTLCLLLERDGITSFHEIIQEAINKLRRRSPHLFDHSRKVTLEEAIAVWKQAKEQEKQQELPNC